MELYIELRGKECCITDMVLHRAEPDVGIMSDGVSDYRVFISGTDEEITESLTAEEKALVDKRITKAIESGAFDCDWDD